jgi:nitrite reductase/ring-hydroxylating ferredoxin subunit
MPRHLGTFPVTRRDFLRASCAGCAALALPACDTGATPVGGVDGAVAGADLATPGSRDLVMPGADLAVPKGDLATTSRDLAGPPADLAPSCDKFFSTQMGPKAFVAGTATFFTLGVDEFFVCRDAGGLYALSAKCTHNFCTINFRAQQKSFVCPCHFSAFALDGTVTQGPAAKALPHLALCIGGDGKVHCDVDTTVPAKTRLMA